MICCVRPIPWVLDSVERLIRANSFELSKIFNFDAGGTVYTRAAGLMSDTGLVGFPLAALKQAMHSPEAARLMLLPYDTLVRQPAEAMAAVYSFTGVAPFDHDFDDVVFDAAEFDARLGTPGLHYVNQSRRGEASVDRQMGRHASWRRAVRRGAVSMRSAICCLPPWQRVVRAVQEVGLLLGPPSRPPSADLRPSMPARLSAGFHIRLTAVLRLRLCPQLPGAFQPMPLAETKTV